MKFIIKNNSLNRKLYVDYMPFPHLEDYLVLESFYHYSFSRIAHLDTLTIEDIERYVNHGISPFSYLGNKIRNYLKYVESKI